MALTTLALTGVDSSSTPVLVAYTQRSTGSNSVEYVGTNANDTLSAPRLIDVTLNIKTPGAAGNDRASVSFKDVVLDENDVAATGSVTITLSIPRSAAFTADRAKSLLKQAADYLGGAHATVSGQTDTSGFPAKWAAMLIP